MAEEMSDDELRKFALEITRTWALTLQAFGEQVSVREFQEKYEDQLAFLTDERLGEDEE